MTLNVAIFGSCVSRDAVGLAPEALHPAHYTARQAWISGTTRGMPMPPVDRLTSPFQRRMLRGDVRSTLLSDITTYAPAADLVLLDIVDDRLGVIEFLPGRFLTLSAELSRSGFLIGDRMLRRRRLHLGEEEHLRRFREAAARVRQTLDDARVLHKTLLVRAPYAATSIEGDTLMGDYGASAEVWNERYAPYYAELDALGFTMIEPDPQLLRATRTHQWGLHPIHYQEPASLDLVRQMLQFHASAR